MTTTEAEPLHLVTVVHERDEAGEVVASTLTFQCLGTVDSDCHLYPDDEVESFSEVPREQWTKHGDCWLKQWFDLGPDGCPYIDEDGVIEDLDSVPAGSGPIDYDWDGCVSWHWVDGPASDTEAPSVTAGEASGLKILVVPWEALPEWLDAHPGALVEVCALHGGRPRAQAAVLQLLDSRQTACAAGELGRSGSSWVQWPNGAQVQAAPLGRYQTHPGWILDALVIVDGTIDDLSDVDWQALVPAFLTSAIAQAEGTARG